MLVIVQGIGLLIVAIGMLGLVNAVTMDIVERTHRDRRPPLPRRPSPETYATSSTAETLCLALIGFMLSSPRSVG